MIKTVLTTKAYMFIGTLLTAGVITGITYNIILSSDEKNNVSNSNLQEQASDTNIVSVDREQYNDLQEQINELKTIIESTQTELIATKQDLTNTQNKVNSLNTQINNLKNNNVKVNSTNSSTQQIISEDKIKQLDDISVRHNKQKELIEEKAKLEKEYNILWEKKCEYINLTGKKREIEAKITTNNSRIIYLTKQNSFIPMDSEEIQKNLKEIEKLKNEIDEFEIQLENINEQIKIKQPTEQEEERYTELYSKIQQIKEELLKY